MVGASRNDQNHVKGLQASWVGGRDAASEQSLTPPISVNGDKAASRRSGRGRPASAAPRTRTKKGRIVQNIVMVAAGLAQELAVEKVDKHLPYSGFGEAVRAVHGDELAADALQLRQRHWGRWQLQGPLDVLDLDLASSFTGMVLLVGGDLGDDVGGGLVELVEVVLLGGRFLELVSWHWH